jgi:hypothetical protein
MTKTRKQYSPKFKPRVAVEAIRGEKTLSSWDRRSARLIKNREQFGGLVGGVY